MKNQINLLVLLAILLTLSITMSKEALAGEDSIIQWEEIPTEVAETTKEAIEPFGGLKWDDSILQIIGKLSAIKGIQEVSLGLGNEKTDVKGVSSRDVLGKKLSDLMLKEFPRILKDLPPMTEQYIGKNGKKQKHIINGLTIKASPIIVTGVPFELIAKFDYAPGLETANPDAVVVEKRGVYTFPLTIYELTLKSNAASLANNLEEMANLLEKKYRKFDVEKNFLEQTPTHEISGGNVSDIYGNKISIHINARSAAIYYMGGEEYKKKVKEVHQKHLADLEKKANSDKADMSSGL